MGSDAEARFCPICETTTDAYVCPNDGVNTVTRTSGSTADQVFCEGRVLAQGRYRIEGKLGAGGMGAVYAATQVAINRTVAVKALLGHKVTDKLDIKRFYREALLASQLKHPHIVEIYDFGVDESTNAPYIVMEYIDGYSLRQVIESEGPLSQRRTAELLMQIARALIAADDKGLVHRDLKPDNVMISFLSDGMEHCKVLDFGIAKSVSGDAPNLGKLTATGNLAGTPAYMSPEQIENRPLDGRSDLYALGCILHEMLSGVPPFVSEEAFGLMLAHIHAARPIYPQPPEDEALVPALRDLHGRLLRVDPEERPADAHEVVAVLHAITQSAGSPSNLVDFPLPQAPRPPQSEFPNPTSTEETLEPKWVQKTNPRFLAGYMFMALVAVTALAYFFWPGASRQSISLASSRDAPVGSSSPVDAGVNVVNLDFGPKSTDAGPAEVGPPAPRRTVLILSDPPAAALFVDGRRMGTTPKRLEIPPGGLVLSVRAKGYDSKLIRLSPKASGRRRVVLMPSIIDGWISR